jgi:peptidoglycan/xylan/chitin deacetylase (PgdA/CDA1 family)
MNNHPINVLMFHSISGARAPICIAPSVFREQMAVLAEGGYRGVSLAQYALWRRGALELRDRFVVLTFDDGYRDFAEAALPEIHSRGWNCTIFLPAGKIGGASDWMNKASCHFPLMDWQTAASLVPYGVEPGAHGINHLDLTRLSPEAAREEIVRSKQWIEDRTGCKVTSFAAPYGRTNPLARRMIGEHYEAAVGVDFAPATWESDLYDLPRIEMYYFRNPVRWSDYLVRGTTMHYRARKALRYTRAFFSRLPRFIPHH